MAPLKKVAFLLIILVAAFSPAYSQLRMHSPYEQDRINPDQTGFILHDDGTADFLWASEWTELTAQSCSDEVALFVWYFKDGTKAYTRHRDYITDFGKNSGYLLAQKSSSLEDARGNNIRPLTKNNFPIKVELWIGEAGETKEYSLKAIVDYLCLSASSIEPNRTYHFSDCP
jgi:hypothetical protein